MKRIPFGLTFFFFIAYFLGSGTVALMPDMPVFQLFMIGAVASFVFTLSTKLCYDIVGFE